MIQRDARVQELKRMSNLTANRASYMMREFAQQQMDKLRSLEILQDSIERIQVDGPEGGEASCEAELPELLL